MSAGRHGGGSAGGHRDTLRCPYYLARCRGWGARPAYYEGVTSHLDDHEFLGFTVQAEHTQHVPGDDEAPGP